MQLIEKHWKIFTVCLMSVWVTLLYAQTLFFELVYFDDHVWLIDYKSYISNIKNIKSAFIQPD